MAPFLTILVLIPTMKNLILASILGSAAAGFAVPALTGPVHFAVTRPYSMYGVLPYNANLPSAVTLGTAPLDFILTDVMIGSLYIEDFKVTVNGSPVLCCGPLGANPYSVSAHLNSGIFIPGGSVVGVTGLPGSGLNVPVTIVGYVQ